MKKILLLIKSLDQGTDLTGQKVYNGKKGLKEKIAVAFEKYRLLKFILLNLLSLIFHFCLGFWFATTSTRLGDLFHLDNFETLNIFLYTPHIFFLGYLFFLVKDFIFNSKDSNYLLSLPFSFTEIMWARIIFLFYNNLPIVFLSVGGLCHFYLEDKISILVSLYALGANMLVYLIIFMFGLAFFIVVSYLLIQIHRLKILEHLLVIMQFGLFMSVIVINIYGTNLHSNFLHGYIGKILEFILPIKFLHASLRSLYEPSFFVYVGALLVMTLLGFGLLYYIANRFYREVVQTENQSTKTSLSKRKKYIKQGETQRVRSAFSALAWTNRFQINSHSFFVFNFYISPLIYGGIFFLGPIIAILAIKDSSSVIANIKDMLATSSIAELYEKAYNFVSVADQHSPVAWFVFVLSVLMCSYALMTGLYSTIFSKDGSNLIFLKSLPFSKKTLYFSRVRFAIFYFLVINSINFLILAVSLALGAYRSFVLLLISISILFIIDVLLQPLLDLKWINLSWTDEKQLSRRHVILVRIFAIIGIGGITCLAFFRPFGLIGEELAYYVVLGVLGLLLVGLIATVSVMLKKLWKADVL